MKVIINLTPKQAALLKAFAALDESTPEEYAMEMLKAGIRGSADGVRSMVEEEL